MTFTPSSFYPTWKQRTTFIPLAGLGIALGSLFVYTFFKSSLRRSVSSQHNGKQKRERGGYKREEHDPDSVAVFWDVDNCSPPTGSSGRVVAQAIRASLQALGLGPIVSFKAYLEISSEAVAPNAAQVQLRSELQGSGVSLIDTPKSGRKDVADKMMITDLLAYAIDQPAPATIVLISGDRDFAYPLGLLRNRGYEVVLITPPIGAVPILEASANVVLSWRQDVLGVEKSGNGRPQSSSGGSTPATPSKNLTGSSKPVFSSQSSNAKTARPTKKSSAQSREVFEPLIMLLEQLRKEGNPKPLRAAVAARLLTTDRGVYMRAGATRWAEYAAVAEAAGLITLGTGGGPGLEWVALRSGVSSSSSISPSAVATTSSRAAGVHRAFLPLIEICKEQRSQGNPKPLSAYVGTQLSLMARQGTFDAYGLAGVSSWREYIVMAQSHGVARAAPTDLDGVYAVELHPKYFNIQTDQAIPGVGRMVDTTALTPTPNDTKLSSLPTEKGLFNSGRSSNVTPPTDLSGTTHFNGQEISTVFFPLAQTLLEQMSEGRNYATDYFLHSILGSSRSLFAAIGGGQQLRGSEQFSSHLEDAVRAKIITVEPGFKPGVRHVRLHPRLWGGGSAGSSSALLRGGLTSKSDSANNLYGVESGNDAAVHRLTTIGFDLSSGVDGTRNDSGHSTPRRKHPSDKDKEKEKLRVKKSLDKLFFLKSSTVANANGAHGDSSGNSDGNGNKEDGNGNEIAKDLGRFKVLLHILIDLRIEKNLASPSKGMVKSEIGKRNESDIGIGAFYQSLGSSGFRDYVEQAKEKGLVSVGTSSSAAAPSSEEEEDGCGSGSGGANDGTDAKHVEWIALSSKLAKALFL